MPIGRAPRTLLAVAGLLLLLAPQGTSEDPMAVGDGPQLFRTDPVLHGITVAECGGVSPQKTRCAVSFAQDACAPPVGCGLDVLGGLGYTGSVTAVVQGTGVDQRPGSIWYGCSFVAGSRTTVLGFGSTCWQGASGNTNACLPECGSYLWPPFTLQGNADALPGAPAPLGSWTVRVDR